MRLQKLPPTLPLGGLFESIGVDKTGIKILAQKDRLDRFFITGLRTPAANILKQDALSIGADLAVPAGTILCQGERVDALLLITPRKLSALLAKMRLQPFGLKALADRLETFLHPPSYPLRLMGVLNINEDSFHAASRTDLSGVIQRAEQMIADGADILDIGAVSSRPGSQPVAPKEELLRLRPVIDALYTARTCDRVTLSLDSYAAEVIAYALDRGFGLINDITGGSDERVLDLAARYGVPLCLMHMQRDPQTMQQAPTYGDVVGEVEAFFVERIKRAAAAGVKELILDVGIGFGKTLAHNVALIQAQGHFATLGYPLLIGASRKSMIDAISPSAVADRLPGTLAIHLKAVEWGASIVRCHDVAEHRQAFRIAEALRQL